MATEYAPGERDPLHEIIKYNAQIEATPDFSELLSSVSYVAFILNNKRQIIFENEKLLQRLRITKNKLNLGKRPGEALSCIHSEIGPSGCGTSSFCKYCGIVNVVLDSGHKQTTQTKEARIMVHNGRHEEQLDIEISASPLKFANNDYTVFTIQDITDKKRKELLERTFFHDIINLAGNLDGIIETLNEMEATDREKFLKIAKRLSNTLIEEIQAQDELVKAENNDLKIKPVAYEFEDLVNYAIESIKHSEVAKSKNIKTDIHLNSEGIITDKTLLNRILVNMLKNALEASIENGTVTFSAFAEKNNFKIAVHNNTVMPDKVQKQLFQRSFSTKGAGRGLGTYSMKLLGERYLNGSINFSSNQTDGTTFTLTIPKKL